MVASAPEAEGRLLGSKYLLYDAIARGGMATVHFGRLTGAVGFSRTVAIKRLHPHLATDPELVAMFLDEARLAARIRHPNVVPTLDVIADAGEVFIVMEYVAGDSLWALVRALRRRDQGERIPIPYALSIIAGALHGLHAAHEVTDEMGRPLGIVHRDISPQNILVGVDGVPRVLDFGVAKAAGRIAETGESGSLKGKIAYMAPEHISGGDVTPRTDVYATAVVLWELLAGERLFDAENDAQRAAKILAAVTAPGGASETIRRPSELNPAVSEALDEIVMRGLAWPPERRFATAKEMALVLERNGGLVPTSDVGDWVQSIAGPQIEARSELLGAIESSRSRKLSTLVALARAELAQTNAAPDAPTAVLPPESVHEPAPIPERPRLRPPLLAIAMLVLLGLCLAAWLLVRGLPAAPPPLASSSAAPPVASPPAPTMAAPEPIAPAVPAAPPSATAAASAAAKPPPARRGATPKPRDDCDPPYTIDADDHKIYKRQCLK